jgi:hypothetical protein
MIPVFEQAKIVHALDRAANVIGAHIHTQCKTNLILNSKKFYGHAENDVGAYKILKQHKY